MKLPEDIGHLMATRYGLDADLCAGPGLAQALQTCREKFDLAEDQALFDHLRLSRVALATLADELLIPESWFFRDRAPFMHLKQWVQEIWLVRKSAERLKILSLPCATGQEPYSIAITLLEAGLNAEQFNIYAGDLGGHWLEQAREGRYRSLAFRGSEFCPKEKYFDILNENDIRVRDEVRKLVDFRVMNLLELGSFATTAPYDVIFCRNVLIYFDEPARKAAVKSLDASLAPDGLLCVGHADAISRITDAYRRIGPPGAFSFERRPAEPKQSKPVPQTLPRKEKPAPVRPVTPVQPALVPKPREVAHKKVAAKPQDLHKKARDLADSGKLPEAEKLCREAMTASPSSVETLYLLAEVLLAQKKIPDGESLLRRVVYLDPGHADALFRLALLAEQRGDAREAANWKRRATKRQLEAAAH